MKTRKLFAAIVSMGLIFTVSGHAADQKAEAKAPQPKVEAAPEASIDAPRAKPVIVATKAPKKEEPEPKGYGKTEGLLGPVTIGPGVSLLGVPHPLEVGLEAKYKDRFGVAGMYGFIPKIKIAGATAELTSVDARVRWFPFRGAFFLGGMYGQQKLKATKSQDITYSGITVPVSAEIEVKTTFLTPHIGWRWLWESGFFLGMDLGWQIALSSKATFTTNHSSNAALTGTAEYQKLDADVTKVGNDIGKTGLPSLTLIHLGFLF